MSVTAPKGFVAVGGAAGIKAVGEPDLAVVVDPDGRAVPTAGVFTSNLAAAAPVQVSRDHLAGNRRAGRRRVLTSGNANAATGLAGREAAERMCAARRGRRRGLGGGDPVCQTGLIGIPFPIESVIAEIAPSSWRALAVAMRERRRPGPS